MCFFSNTRKIDRANQWAPTISTHRLPLRLKATLRQCRLVTLICSLHLGSLTTKSCLLRHNPKQTPSKSTSQINRTCCAVHVLSQSSKSGFGQFGFALAWDWWVFSNLISIKTSSFSGAFRRTLHQLRVLHDIAFGLVGLLACGAIRVFVDCEYNLLHHCLVPSLSTLASLLCRCPRKF